MDTSVALVQAYLHINGYFTVAEYPVLEAYRGGTARTVTDLDILAFRFAGATHDVVHGHGTYRPARGASKPDPALGCPSDCPDMIVGEVKEGPARFNDATCDPAVLAVALSRFGCCSPEHAHDLTHRLLTTGRVKTPAGHVVRMVAFGDMRDTTRSGKWATVSMRHIVEFLRTYLHEHWGVLRHAQIKDSTLAVLALLEKWRAEEPDRQHV